MRQLKFICNLGLALGAGIVLNACDVSDGGSQSDKRSSGAAIVDYPIAYITRPIPVDEDGERVSDNLLEPNAFNPGAKLLLKNRASVSAEAINITYGIFGLIEEGDNAGEEPLYDIKDLASSPLGNKLAFAMRAPEIEGADEEDQPKWNIWQYEISSGNLQRIIRSDIVAEQGDDVAPTYLPNGDLIFSSNRQRGTRGLLLDELKPQYSGLDDKRRDEAFTLHRIQEDGEELEQISYNGSHDLQPTVLDSGEIAYLRWDAISNAHNQISLYKMRPDGSQNQILYGFHSQNTGTEGAAATYSRPIELLDGRIAVILRPTTTAKLGGKPVVLDVNDFIDNQQPSYNNFGAAGPAQTDIAAPGIDERNNQPSIEGLFNSIYPLYDGTGRYLVSRGACRLREPESQINRPCVEPYLSQSDIELGDPLFSIWIYDPINGTQLPVTQAEEGVLATEAIALGPRPVPNGLVSELDPELKQEGVGLLHIRSIYDLDGVVSVNGGIAGISDPTITPTDQRQMRFLRLVKNVPFPSDEVLDFDQALIGFNRSPRDIIGYVPVEPDGSVEFKVPADVAFKIEALDALGKRINNNHHDIWLSLRPGEVRECKGCHSRNSTEPHGRADAEAPSVNIGAAGGLPFSNSRLVDEFDQLHPAPEFEESMAQYYTRVEGPRIPAMDIVFTDEWTDPAVATPGTDISLRYIDMQARVNANPRDPACSALEVAPPQWSTPFSPADCSNADDWRRQCRITINYLSHIAPLWEADRRSCDAVSGEVVADFTCTSCHTRTRADGSLQVPLAQLELTAQQSSRNNDYITSYVELLRNDLEQEIVDGALIPRSEQRETGEFETDPETGELIIDPETNMPIPIYETITFDVAAPASTNGARSSNRFFSRFESNGSHEGYLSPAELKLIAEWLDIGAQYYNNPFAIPAD